MADIKLKITAAGWATFNGTMCGVKFTNGVSDNVIPRLTVNRISAIIACDAVAADGTSQGQAGVAAAMTKVSQIPAPTDLALDVMTPAQLAAERKAAMDQMLRNPASKLYTQAELEDIGTKEGIKGVRVIGDKWGVKERSISNLITLILEAQTEYISKVNERNATEKANRDAALAASTQAVKDRQAAIDAQARVLTPDGTSNAIGEDGKPVHTDPKTVHRFTHNGITVETTDPDPASAAGAAAVADALNTTATTTEATTEATTAATTAAATTPTATTEPAAS